MADLITYQWLQVLAFLVCSGVIALLATSCKRIRDENKQLLIKNKRRNSWWWNHPDVLVSIDQDGRIREANRPFMGRELVSGSRFHAFLPQTEQSGFRSAMAAVMNGQSVAPLDILFSDPGSRYILHIKPDDSHQGCCLVFIQDVSFQLRECQQLRQEKEKAERSNLAKSRFLASMSHEIRTPMTGLLGMVSLMEQTRLDDEQQGYQRVIQSSSEHLLAIINDILDISKIDAGKLSIEEEVFDLPELIQNLLDMGAGRAQEKHLAMQSFVDNSLPRLLVGDAVRIRQILMNFLNNAIKFTNEGHVLLRVVLVKNHHTTVQLRFSVEDSGIGISSSRVMALFEEYSFAHGRISTEAGGTGLGLSICQRLAKLMDGHVGVVSTPGVGSNFWFDVTLPVASEVQPAPVPGRLPTDQAIWICDEIQVNRTLLISVARSLNMQSREFSRIEDVSIALQSEQPALLVLSYRAWQEGDDELHQRFQRDDLKVAMCSSDVMAESREQLLDSGIGAYWDWPVSQSNLKDILERLLQQQQPIRQLITRTSQYVSNRKSVSTTAEVAETSTEYQSQPDPLKGRRILLAEDNLVNQKVATQMLKRLGCEVVVAENGQQALEISNEQSFDLILMDCHMPVMDGLEACRRIREREFQQGGTNVAIVALSADVMSDRKGACEEAGMNGYLAKPVRLEDLRRELPEFMPERQQEADS